MKYKSENFEVLHENAVEMYKIGGITEASMREYDEMCLAKPKVKQESVSIYNKDNDTVNLEHINHASV
jgi:DNA-binding transcriptional regulator YiaG